MSPRVFSAFVLVLFPGCLITPDTFEDARAQFLDGDGDGISEWDGDCAPDDPATFPGAVEVCDNKDNDCDGQTDEQPEGPVWFFDGDTDGFGDAQQVLAACVQPEGFVEEDGDCNDTDPSIHPGQAEACNDRDDDCDGTVDEDAPPSRSWYPDQDGDGFGNPATPLDICADPGGAYVLDGTDCDDLDDAVYPGAPEACNDRDDDCDDLTDEAPTTDPLSWTLDDDRDGYGRDDTLVVQCLSPGDRYVLQGGDCNDSEPAVHPNADEYCNDRDDDCDDAVDEPPTVGEGTWYVDLDSDGYGDDSSPESSCDGGPGMVDIGGDCDDTDATINPAQAEVCNDGADNNCDGTPNSCVWPGALDMVDYQPLYGGVEYSALGWSGGTGDLDGDGVDEVLVGTPAGYDPVVGSWMVGCIYSWAPSSARPTLSNATSRVYSFDESIGSALDVGDLDGDGYDDLVAGGYGLDLEDGTRNVGGGWVILGPVSTMVPTSTNAWQLIGDTEYSWIGDSVRVLPDLDGDGLLDFALTSEDDSSRADKQGAVYLFTTLGSGAATVADEATAVLKGETEYDYFGEEVTATDLDGDGVHDVIVAVGTGAHGQGGASVFFGPVYGDYGAADADITVYGDGTAQSIDTLGDTNGDGYGDVVLGSAYSTNATGRGNVYVFWGSASFSTTLVDDAAIKIRGDRTEDWFGFVVQNLGDVNQDGVDDLGVTSAGAGSDEASAYLYWGPFTGAATLGSTADSDVLLEGDGRTDAVARFITSADYNADTVPDIIVGSPSGGTDDEGAAYFVSGVGF